MERLQGPINPCYFGEHLEVECLGEGLTSSTAGVLRLEEEEAQCLSIPELDERMPFLQMLQSVESSPPFYALKESSFQALLRFQHLKNYNNNYSIMPPPEMELETHQLHHHPLDQLESCITHDTDIHISDKDQLQHSPIIIKSEAKDLININTSQNHPHSTSATSEPHEGVTSSECNPEQNPISSTSASASASTSTVWGSQTQTQTQPQPQPQLLTTPTKQTHSSKYVGAGRERRKRKRTRPAKNKEEVESQRMTHIAVERNRRRQMNDHLNVLRSLMPTSYIQRGDQASIVGGAIDFVKELEQLLQSLEAQKRMRKSEGGNNDHNGSETPVSSSSSSAAANAMAVSSNGMFMSLSQYKIGSDQEGYSINNTTTPTSTIYGGDDVMAENKSETADIEVTVIQTHVNLKIQCPRRPGQLLKAIVALEDLRLSILHLNITTSQSTVLYSFNLKIEDGCKLGSADEIAGAVHQIFKYMESS